MKRYHIMPAGEGWTIEQEGGKRALRKAPTKIEAVTYMREYMKEREGSVVIHKKNGQIQEERTYPRSSDPRRRKG